MVGAGAAGLSAAAALSRPDAVVVDGGDRVGDCWRRRYDGLRLFTAARHCALPGMPLPMPGHAHPGKDEYADYLERYASRLPVPVHLGVRVLGHRFRDGRHELSTTRGTIVADRVVWAAGGNARPVVPAFAAGLAPSIRQTHSAEFHGVADLAPGPVLVVGAGQSGADIAGSVCATHVTYLAGARTSHVPAGLVQSPALQAFYRLPVPAGRGQRPLQRLLRRGSPLVWNTERRLAAAGVRRLPRVTGVRDGRPLIGDNPAPPVTTVIWCTGLRPALGWLDPRALDGNGMPRHVRGVSTTLPGLGFVGLRLQRTLGSGFLPSFPADARFVVSALEALTPVR